MRHLPLFIVACMILVAAVGCSPTPEATPAPGGETPKTEAPKTDTPKTDAPKTDAPKTDAPKTDAPTATTADFMTKTAPSLQKFCTPCHVGDKAKGGLDITSIKSNDDAKAAKDKLAKAAT
ncbi:MAG: hypothetical protein ABUL72_05910, partial [Armatimonadota bacterium]